MCSHRLATVLDQLHSAVRLVLVNSSRASSSSGGVVVIERQVEVLRSADVVALGCVRLRCRQAIEGGWGPGRL